MPESSLFLNALFQHHQLIKANPYQPALNRASWDCKVGIFSNLVVTHGGESEKLLQGMMAACKLTPDDWKIFPKNANYQATLGLEQLKYLLLIGISEKEINLDTCFPYYKPVSFARKIWIKVPAFETLLKDVDAKKQLWNIALKPLFS